MDREGWEIRAKKKPDPPGRRAGLSNRNYFEEVIGAGAGAGAADGQHEAARAETAAAAIRNLTVFMLFGQLLV
jgi:hypothetical protein